MPVPPETKAEPRRRRKAGGSSQKLMLFIRGKAMSGAQIMSGTKQLPKPPLIAGMHMKKTMMRLCAVMSTFHRCSDSSIDAAHDQAYRYWTPGTTRSQDRQSSG